MRRSTDMMSPNGTLRILSLSTGQKYCSMRSQRRDRLSVSIRSETLVGTSRLSGRLVSTRGFPTSLSHASVQMEVVSPFPILLREPSAIRNLAAHKPLHVAEGRAPSFPLMKSPLGKYQALKILPTRVSGLVRILHPFLASKARLKLRRSRKPRPPLAFAVHKCCHEIQATFFLFSLSPPKAADSGLHFIQNLFREKKASHNVGRDGLKD